MIPVLCCSAYLLQSQQISPDYRIKTSGAITYFVIDKSNIILSTDAGTIETYKLNDGKKVSIKDLPMMKDFMGDAIATKVFSIDYQNQALLIVTQGNHGFRNVFIVKGEGIDTIISSETHKMLIKKARFINESKILLGLMSNELVLYDIEKKETVYTFYISPYTFSDFSLSEEKKFVYTSDESGIVHQIDVRGGF